MPKRELTNRQKIFISEYLKDQNGAQAAIRAGYSKKTAKQMATENLSKPYLKKIIDYEIKKRKEKNEKDAKWLREELENIYLELRSGGHIRLALHAIKLLGAHVEVQAWLDRKDHTTLGDKMPNQNFSIDLQTAKILNKNIEKDY